MGKKNRNLFSDVIKDVSNVEPTEDKTKTRKSTYLETRKTELSDIFDGNIEEKTLRWVDPEECKMWENHNRRYDLLNEVRCQDLIEGIKAQGKQEFPAIVRLSDDPEYKYEVICGARRHWTIQYLRDHNFPNFKFLIEVRKLSDEEAFRLSDVENRDKEDISDYERALDYRMALTKYYKTQKTMAQRLEVSEAWLSRYLQLAELPKAIVDLFNDIRFLKVETGKQLRPLIKDPDSLQHLLDCARELRRHESYGKLSDSEILKALKASNSTTEAIKATKKLVMLPGSNKKLFSFERKATGKIDIKLEPVKSDTIDVIKEELLKALDETID